MLERAQKGRGDSEGFLAPTVAYEVSACESLHDVPFFWLRKFERHQEKDLAECMRLSRRFNVFRSSPPKRRWIQRWLNRWSANVVTRYDKRLANHIDDCLLVYHCGCRDMCRQIAAVRRKFKERHKQILQSLVQRKREYDEKVWLCCFHVNASDIFLSFLCLRRLIRRSPWRNLNASNISAGVLVSEYVHACRPSNSVPYFLTYRSLYVSLHRVEKMLRQREREESHHGQDADMKPANEEVITKVRHGEKDKEKVRHAKEREKDKDKDKDKDSERERDRDREKPPRKTPDAAPSGGALVFSTRDGLTDSCIQRQGAVWRLRGNCLCAD